MIKLPNITIHNMDCMEAMREMKDNEFELAIVDPPYGINIAKSGKVGGGELAKVKDYGAKIWDIKSPSNEYFNELMRVSENQIIWGANHFLGLKSPCWIVWDKDNNSNDFADCELAYTSFKSAVRRYKYRWNGMLQENMKHKEHRIHPTQKPVALYKWLLQNYAKPGDRILDTHLGSGSIAIACLELGFDLVGYEIDKDYYDAAMERIQTKQEALTLGYAKTKLNKSDQKTLF